MESIMGVIAVSIMMLIVIVPMAILIRMYRRANDAIRGVPRMASKRSARAVPAAVIPAAPAVITAQQMGVRFPERRGDYHAFETPAFVRRGFEAVEEDAFGVDFDFNQGVDR